MAERTQTQLQQDLHTSFGNLNTDPDSPYIPDRHLNPLKELILYSVFTELDPSVTSLPLPTDGEFSLEAVAPQATATFLNVYAENLWADVEEYAAKRSEVEREMAEFVRIALHMEGKKGEGRDSLVLIEELKFVDVVRPERSYDVERDKAARR